MYIFIEFIFKPNCSSWYIEFFNNNWDIKSINIASYLIISKTFYSNIEFTDFEADRVSLKYTYNNLVNIFIRQTPNKNLSFDIIMQTETVSQTQTLIIKIINTGLGLTSRSTCLHLSLRHSIIVWTTFRYQDDHHTTICYHMSPNLMDKILQSGLQIRLQVGLNWPTTARWESVH